MQTALSDTAYFGGTFDPVHLGHLYLLHQAALHTPFFRIIVSPVAINNFKTGEKAPLSGETRLEMLSLALEDYRELYPDDGTRIIIDDSDVRKGGVSYAYDSIVNIRKKYGIEGRIGYLVGDDILPGLARWHRIKELISMVEFFVFTRDGVPTASSIPYHPVKIMPYKQSSTELRDGGSLLGLSKRVREYVRANELY
jgi:cytidyltransferase-related domain